MLLTGACVLGLLSVQSSAAMDLALRQPYSFAYSVFQEMASGSQANVALSTGALINSLALLYEASAGDTEDLIADVVQFPTSKQRMRTALNSVREQVRASLGPHNVYQGATRVFVAADVPLTRRFKTVLDAFYPCSGVETLNFARTEAAAARINGWANQSTAGSIPTIVTPDTLGGATVAAIISAEYFRGLWATPFHPANTRELPFHVSAGETLQTPLMYARGMHRVVWVPGAGYSLLRLGYQDSGLSCVFVLPDEGKSVSQVMEAARTSFLGRPDIFDNSLQSCEIFVPKFTLEASVDLAPVFSQMGRLGKLLSQPANFSSMVDGRLLSIGGVTQKTRVQVNEEGATAAAAQEVEFTWRMMAEHSCRFIVNRPFGFVVQQDGGEGISLPLVLGLVVRPAYQG